MKLKNGKWRELGDMWEQGERTRLGRIAIVEDINPGIFMLDKNEIFRYDMTSNRWWKETSVPERAADESSVGFVALDGELHVMALHTTENRRSRRLKRSASLFLQIYHPEKKIWRTPITKPPFQQSLDFKTAVMCTIRL